MTTQYYPLRNKDGLMVNLTQLTTEQRNPLTYELDTFSPMQIAQVMNDENKKAIEAIDSVLDKVANAIELGAVALQSGGRIIYQGAGTSGRLGVLDAVECPPTFGVSANTVVGLIAGGNEAFLHAIEDVEDDESQGEADLAKLNPTDRDLVVGIAASGRTPYVIGGLEFARSIGCKTVAISCVGNSAIGEHANLAIEVATGPEVLTGSTRLKAGTVQKIILNMISTGSMTLTGKVYQNLMVDVKQTNEKLRARAQNIVCQACNCSAGEAQNALEDSAGDVKAAIVSIELGVSTQQANLLLSQSNMSVRKAIELSIA